MLHVFHSLLSLPFSLFTYIRPDGLLTEIYNCHGNNHGTVPIYRRQDLSGLGTILARCLPTEQHLDPSQLQGLQQREANGIGERRKTTETESRSSLSTVYACFPPKLNNCRCQPIRSQHYVCVSWMMHVMLRSDWFASAIIQLWREISLCTRKLWTEMSVILASS